VGDGGEMTQTLYEHMSKKNFFKCSLGANGVAQEIEYLPSKHQALSSNPGNAKKERKCSLIE
jgi:hypothetical protein